jgi:chromosome segregation ATPase
VSNALARTAERTRFAERVASRATEIAGTTRESLSLLVQRVDSLDLANKRLEAQLAAAEQQQAESEAQFQERLEEQSRAVLSAQQEAAEARAESATCHARLDALESTVRELCGSGSASLAQQLQKLRAAYTVAQEDAEQTRAALHRQQHALHSVDSRLGATEDELGRSGPTLDQLRARISRIEADSRGTAANQQRLEGTLNSMAPLLREAVGRSRAQSLFG